MSRIETDALTLARTRVSEVAPTGWARLAYMNRDMELVRDICRAVKAKASRFPEALDLPGADPDMLGSHLVLMIQAGFLTGQISETIGRAPPFVLVGDFTWQGHDFADAILNEGVWSKLKEKVGIGELARLPLEVLSKVGQALLEAWLKQQVGLE